MRWITRERPRIDRIACPWLIARFIDGVAQIEQSSRFRVCDSSRNTDWDYHVHHLATGPVSEEAALSDQRQNVIPAT